MVRERLCPYVLSSLKYWRCENSFVSCKKKYWGHRQEVGTHGLTVASSAL